MDHFAHTFHVFESIFHDLELQSLKILYMSVTFRHYPGGSRIKYMKK